MTQPNHRWSRRHILQGLGLGAAWLPLLNTTRALAATPATLPPNVVFIPWPNGSSRFWPSGGVTDFVISDADDSVLKPLIPWRDRILLLQGMNVQNLLDHRAGVGGHAALPFIFTGVAGVVFNGLINDSFNRTAGGPTLDYWLATQIAAKEGGTPLSKMLVQRALRQNGNDVFTSYVGGPIGGQPNPVQPYDNPVELFDKLFAAPGTTGADAARLRAQKRSVLDVVGKQLERTCQRLGAEDRAKCEAHLTAVRDYEKTATQIAATGSCVPPPEPARDKNYTAGGPNQLLPEIHQLQMGMLTTAFGCGMARTGSLGWCNSINHNYHFKWLASKDPAFAGGSIFDDGVATAAYLQHHEIGHNEFRDAASQRRKNWVDQWFVQQLADLMARLHAVKEGDTTLLDRTLIVFANLQATGQGHELTNIPLVLAGNCHGYFQMGRFLRLGSSGGNKPMNGLLTEICNAMGFARDAFGDYSGNLPTLRA